RELARERVADPVHRIIGVGQRRPTSTQVVQTPQGPKRYRRVLEVLATAYTPGPESTWPFTDGLTATGVVARRGVVAVDPTVIPWGATSTSPATAWALPPTWGRPSRGTGSTCFTKTWTTRSAGGGSGSRSTSSTSKGAGPRTGYGGSGTPEQGPSPGPGPRPPAQPASGPELPGR